jgi:cytochrome oxidase Cu insertion factor (SCO1/SenC/PrrC family)
MRLAMGAAAVALCTAHAEEPSERSAAKLMEELMWGRAEVGGPFELIDHTGRKRTDADFRGKFLLVYFGYTFCPDVCPTDLAQIAEAIDRLGADGGMVHPLFITVDPERDTPEVLRHYVSYFHPRLIGLTGTAEQVRSAARAYKAYYAKAMADGGGDYSVDHSGFIYVMDPSGKYLGFFPPGTNAQRMVEILKLHLSGERR